MSRLDVQLSKASGEKAIRIDWPDDGSVDVELFRAKLILEIDSHAHRIPIDLRGVKGAPPELVEILITLQRYARSKSKELAITWGLPPMRDALAKRSPGEQSEEARPQANGEAASNSAKKLLTHVETKPQYDLSSAEKIERPKKSKPKSKGLNRYAKLALIIVLAAGTIAAIEAVIVFQQPESVVLPRKGFE